MSRFMVRGGAVVSLIFTAACSQTPAHVDLKGSQVFAQSPSNGTSGARYHSSPSRSYSAPAQIYSSVEPPPRVSSRTQQSAAVQSIGVSDLAPPDKKEAKKVEAKLAETHKVNPWTGKARGIESSELGEPKQEKTVARLDSVPEKATARKKDVKPVKLVGAKQETATYMWPVSGRKVVSGYGPKGAGKVNDGINIASPEGEPVWASADGEVVYVGNELQGYGNMVLIKHSGNKTTTYAHLNRATVDKYDRVKQGDIIGYVGSTGNVSKPQLHFAIRDGKDPVDPRKYLSSHVAGL